MGLLLLIIGSVIGLFLVLGVAIMLASALRWLFWMAIRLGLAAIIVAAIVLAGASLDADGGATALAALVVFALTVVATRHWGRPTEPLPLKHSALPPPSERAPTRPTPAASTLPYPETLVPAELQARLDATQRALAHAARDGHGAKADEWLTFWRRRVPDLIAAARAHHDDLDAAGKAVVAKQLIERLNDLIAEAEHRIAIAVQSRSDLFTIRSNHAERRARHG